MINQFDKCAYQVESDLVEGRREHKRILEANKMLRVKDGLDDFVAVFASRDRRKKENIKPKLLDSGTGEKQSDKLISVFKTKEIGQQKAKPKLQRKTLSTKLS